MKRSDISTPPCYFDRYISQVEDIELEDAFTESLRDLESLDLSRLDGFADRAYAPGKWTLKEQIQHLIDVEHVFTYRSLRVGRNDKTALPGFDQDLLAANVDLGRRTLKYLIDELILARRVTHLLFQSFDEVALQRTAVVSNMEMSPLAFGFTILGHQKHHLKLIEELYR